MSGGVATIDRELADYRKVASDLHVGVNHLALDEERVRQEQFFDGITDLQRRIKRVPDCQERYGEEVENLKNGIRLNADVLKYLKNITKLEGPLTELTNKITEAAVSASSPGIASSAIFANKTLTENVNNCWEYIAQLSSIVQAHLKNSAAYQQFHHMANEVGAHIDKMVGLAEMKMLLFDPEGAVDEAVFLSKELEADHVEMTRMWEQTCQLTEMARHLQPVQNRISRVVNGRVVDGPAHAAQQMVMAKALINFSGPNYAIRKGEEMVLMNNENPNFWRVKTTFGEREVPSVILATIGPNQDEVFKANSLQKSCVSNWKRLLERTKGKLVKYYSTLFEAYCKNDAIYFAHEDAMNAFLDDVDSVLIAPNYDSGILHKAYDKFTRTLMLLSPNRRPPRGTTSLTELDIRTLHAPLRRVLSQLAHVDQIQARVSMNADEVQRYLKSVEDERQHILNEITRMEQMEKEKEDQLKSLADKMNAWKNNRKAFDRAISDFTSEPLDDILRQFPSTRLGQVKVVENDYRIPSDNYEGDSYDSSSRSHTRLGNNAASTTEYGHVARQMVTSNARSKAGGITFSGGVTQERESGNTWAGNAMNLKKSASTNDLQTQVINIKAERSTQYDKNEHRLHNSGSGTFYDGSHRSKATGDVQAQISHAVKHVSSQVGVRVMPKAVDLSRVGIGNLGVEVQNSRESAGLGLRVGEILCPVTVGTSIDLYEGPGVQVVGINDVDSLDLQLKDTVAHATADAHRKLKVRDVQAQVVTSSGSRTATSMGEDLISGRETSSSEAQTLIGVMHKTMGVQAVASMEVVNIPGHEQKKRVTGTANTSFCLLPESRTHNLEHTQSAPSRSDVITQISCLLHSRGVYSDLESYLSDYKEKNKIPAETSDSNTWIQDRSVGRGAVTEDTKQKPRAIGSVEGRTTKGRSQDMETLIQTNTGTVSSQRPLKSSDTETLISLAMREAGTQVSSKLVPTEVTVGKIEAANMEISFVNPLREVDFGVPVESFVCPADMKFRSELYEGSDFKIADYDGLSNLFVVQADSAANVSIAGVRDGLKTQAAVVLRTSKNTTEQGRFTLGEIIATSKSIPKLKLVATDIVSSSNSLKLPPTSDLQTQISYTNASQNNSELSPDVMREAPRSHGVDGAYSTGKRLKEGHTAINISDPKGLETGELVCPQCLQRYREVPQQFDPDIEVDETRNVSKISTQNRTLNGLTARQGCQSLVDVAVQVAVELIPTEISMSNYDIENMELEIGGGTNRDNYQMQIKSVACPAKVKMNTRLVDGSGVHVVGIDEASRITVGISSALGDRAEGKTNYSSIENAEFLSSVTFEHPSKAKIPARERQERAQSEKRNPIRLVPCRLARRPESTDSICQILSVTTDASTQVGTQLIPQAIGVSPVSMENMEVSVKSTGRGIREQNLSASALLYPAHVKLSNRLVDEQCGIELVPLEDVKVVQMENPQPDSLIHYRLPSASSDVQTQIETRTPELKGSNLLPASIVMETGQFEGHRRVTPLKSNSAVCELLSDPAKYLNLSIQFTSSSKMTSEYGGPSSSHQIGYVTMKGDTQNGVLEIRKNVVSPHVPMPKTSTLQKSVGVQIGTRLIPHVLKVAQMPVSNLSLESVSANPRTSQNLSLQSLRYPAEITMKTELCEDGGIVVCSLDQSKEIGLRMAGEVARTSQPPLMSRREQSSNMKNAVSGWWSSIVSGRAPLLEDKPMSSAVMKLPTKEVQASPSNLLSDERDWVVKAEAILEPLSDDSSCQTGRNSSHYPDPPLKLVINAKKPGHGSKSANGTVNGSSTSQQELGETRSNFSPLIKREMIDHGNQVGVKLVPNSVEIKRMKLENMEAVLSSKRTSATREIDISAILCASGMEYHEELAEASGVHVAHVDDTNGIFLSYGGKSFSTAVSTTEKRKLVAGSISGGEPRGNRVSALSVTGESLLPSNFSGAECQALESGDFVAKLRVKDTQHTSQSSTGDETEQKGSIHAQTSTKSLDKDVQVGLSLIPKAVSVESVEIENLDVVNERSERGDVKQIPVNAMLCTRPTQYDEVLTESQGVNVLPLEAVEDMQITHRGETYYSTARAKPEKGEFSGSQRAGMQPRLRVHHAEFTADPGARKVVGCWENGASNVRVDGTTQGGVVFMPTDLGALSAKRNDAGTQVGAVIIPQHLSMERMTLEARNSTTKTQFHETKVESVLYPTSMGADIALQEVSGVTVADFDGNVSVQYNNAEYSANIKRTSTNKDASIHLQTKSISLSRKWSGLEVSLCKPHTESSTTRVPENLQSQSVPVGKRLISKTSQVGTLLVPSKVCMDKLNVDHLAVDIPVNEWQIAEMNVSAVLAPTATEMVPIIAETTGIRAVEVKDLNELGIQVGDQVYIANVVASPKSVSGNYQRPGNYSSNSTGLSKKREVITISVPRPHDGVSMSHQAADLLKANPHLREVHACLQCPSVQPRLRIGSTSGTGMRTAEATDSQFLGATKPFEPANLTCGAKKQYASADLSSHPTADVGDSVVAPDKICGETNFQQGYHVTCEAAIHPTMLSKRLTANIRPFSNDVASQFAPEKVSGTKRTHKRTHSAESHTYKKADYICTNCQKKLMSNEVDGPASYKASITISGRNNDNLFGNFLSTSFSRTSSLRSGHFSGASGKRLSGSSESLGTQSMSAKCTVCNTELTSGDLTTSIRTSTSSLLGTEAAVHVSTKEIAEAYTRICTASGQIEHFGEPQEHTSLYQALKQNRIVQALINDYEKDTNGMEGFFSAEAKEIVDVVAMTNKQNAYFASKPAIYSQLRNNTLTDAIVQSYEAYKQSRSEDVCVQTDLIQNVGGTFENFDVQEIAHVVDNFERSGQQTGPESLLYTNLKGNPIIQRVIREYEQDRKAVDATWAGGSTAQTQSLSHENKKMRILNVDGHIAKMESEQFVPEDGTTKKSFPVSGRGSKGKPSEKPISSSVSSDSEGEVSIPSYRPIRQSSISSQEPTYYDVACSAFITPETWDKKVQAGSTNLL